MIQGEICTLHPLDPTHVDALREIRQQPVVAQTWGDLEPDFPLHDEPGTHRFAVVLDDDQVVGMVQYGEETEPDFRHAWIDIFLSGEFHNRGIGTDAVLTLAHHVLDTTHHHRITIDPEVENLAAVRAYTKAGFRHVGVLQRAWCTPAGEWVDVLFMEMVRNPRR